MLGSQPAVGLDVGSSLVKVAQLRRTTSGVELEKFGMAAVDVGADGERAGPEAKVDAIRRAVASARIGAKQVVTGVSGESIIVRYLQLPDMPEEELRSALRYEAEEYIPYNIEDCYLDSDTLGRHYQDNAAKVDVLLVSARKELVENHTSMVRAAGLQPVVVDVDSFAFFNCFEMNYQPSPDEVVALVNIGSNVTTINIYHEGTSRFSRDISVGGNTITSSIQTKLGLNYQEAEELKLREGLPASAGEEGGAGSEDAEANSLLDTIRGAVERITGEELGEDTAETVAAHVSLNTLNTLLVEIRRSLQFFESQPNAKPVTRVVLGGGTAKMRGVDAFFENDLKLPVETIDPLLRVSPHGRHLDVAELSDNKVLLGVCIGLALRKVMESR